MPTSRLSKFLQGVTVTALTSVGAFFVYTKHCKLERLNLATDKTYQSLFYKKFNPNGNPPLHDVIIRRIPLIKLQPELVKDSAQGGSKLVETFCAGVWGGFGYTIQRLYLSNKYQNSTTTAHQLWTRSALLSSPYDAGTEITDHFVVLSKTPSTILIRCGDSPLNSPDAPRDSDGLFELNAEIKLDEGFAEFRMKSLFFKGTGRETLKPMSDSMWMEWAHQQYAKLWMETAVRNCMT